MPNRFKRLLVPLDGSKLAETVVPSAITLATGYHAQVILLNILERSATESIHGEKHLLDPQEAKTYLEGVAAKLQENGVESEIHVHDAPEGDVAASIVSHADEFAPDLVVLCSHGSSGLRGLIYGRIAQQVLRLGTWPILVLQAPDRNTKQQLDLTNILLPLDGNDEHEIALTEAMSLTKVFRSTLHLAFVVPTVNTLTEEGAAVGAMLPSTMRVILDMAEQEGIDYLGSVARRCKEEGLQVTTSVLRGEPVPTLLAHARKKKIGLVVMASHGKAGLEALLSNAVGPRVVRKVDCPMLLVRARGE